MALFKFLDVREATLQQEHQLKQRYSAAEQQNGLGC